MTKDFLLEIGMEEMPAKFAPGAMAQLEEMAAKRLAELRLLYQSLHVYVTPRRLALLVKGLAEKQTDLNAEVKGPAAKAAYDGNGQPTKAALGFARGQGVAPEDLYTQEVNGVPYVFARKSEAGQDTATLLPAFALDMIKALHFPKPMRWGELDFRFARPIRWLVALFGTEVVPFDLVGLSSDRITYGHRTLAKQPVALKRADAYVESLRSAYVLVDPITRRINIWGQIEALATQTGGVVREDEELLGEVTHLVEFPTALLGSVDQRYMHLPEAVITTPMREHQRYFPVHGRDGKLLPYFITVRNGDAKALAQVKAGNEKVLKARLEDAAFYYREDQKIPLAELVPKLEKIVYHEKLGTVRQRVERLQGLSRYIVKALGLGSQTLELVERTAFLAKADLVTLMVYDFPELQGIMGAEYAARSREKTGVCQGILEHYQPRSASDALPASDPGRVVSIADKIDAIVGAFGIGIQPTGSQDPYALRRQAQGIVNILLANGWDLSLIELIKESYGLFTGQGTTLAAPVEVLPALQDFFRQRLRFALQEEGLRYDTVDAVLGQDNGFPNKTAVKARILAAKRDEADFGPYVQAYVRCNNLIKKAAPQGLDSNVLVDSAEIALAEAVALRRERFDSLLAAGDFGGAYRVAAEIVPLIEQLFAAVMIMVEDEELKKARLALLGQCVELLGCLGDLSLLAI